MAEKCGKSLEVTHPEFGRCEVLIHLPKTLPLARAGHPLFDCPCLGQTWLQLRVAILL